MKRYAHLRHDMERAVTAFTQDVRARRFPADEHCYTIEQSELDLLLASLDAPPEG